MKVSSTELKYKTRKMVHWTKQYKRTGESEHKTQLFTLHLILFPPPALQNICSKPVILFAAEDIQMQSLQQFRGMRRSSALKHFSVLSLLIFLLQSFLYNVDFTSNIIAREEEVYEKPVVLPKATKDLNHSQTTQHSEITDDAENKHKDDSIELNSSLPSKPNTPPTIAYGTLNAAPPFFFVH